MTNDGSKTGKIKLNTWYFGHQKGFSIMGISEDVIPSEHLALPVILPKQSLDIMAECGGSKGIRPL